MKKRSFFLMLFVVTATMAMSQETVTLTFSANTANGLYHRFSEVHVTNVTRGWTETLFYPDTVLILVNGSSIGESVSTKTLFNAYPNPFIEETFVPLQMANAGLVNIQVFDINGKTEAEKKVYLEQGIHQIKITLDRPQLAFLVVTTPQGRHITKLIHAGHGGLNTISLETEQEKDCCVSKEVVQVGEFEIGDIMNYEAIWDFDGKRVQSNTVMQEQFSDENIILVFSAPEGAINGLFSVNETTKVYFSQGNLRCQPCTGTWQFANNQFDMIITSEDMTYYWDMGISGGYYYAAVSSHYQSSYDGWIDLFGWGTSGYDHGAECYSPWCTNSWYGYYYAYGHGPANLFEQTGQADWGYNAIYNGGNTEHSGWRTLTESEWDYLLCRNTSSEIIFAKAKVNEVNGLILLPDNWSISTYSLNNTNDRNSSFDSNVLTTSQWSILEDAGAVFLPTSGRRYEDRVGSAGSGGFYWSSSCNADSHAININFDNIHIDKRSDHKYYGCSVRLVRNAE